MDTITQIARFRQSVVKFSFDFGVISAVKRFNVSGGSVYRRRKRCNGSPESLVEYSRFCCIQTDNGLEFIKAFDERKKGKKIHSDNFRVRQILFDMKTYLKTHYGTIC